VLRALVSEDLDVLLELEPRISLLWCESHMAWHRVRYSVRLSRDPYPPI
jgi:predicted transcriptional regulator